LDQNERPEGVIEEPIVGDKPTEHKTNILRESQIGVFVNPNVGISIGAWLLGKAIGVDEKEIIDLLAEKFPDKIQKAREQVDNGSKE
jgi:hypothetical protein